jgi:hypothetical protein
MPESERRAPLSVGGTKQLSAEPGLSPVGDPAATGHCVSADDGASFQTYGAMAPVVVLRVQCRRGVWEVTRNGKFFGHYGRLPAIDAAVAAARSIVALLRRADVAVEHEPSAARDHTHGVPDRMRTLYFRPPPVVSIIPA